MNYGWDSEGIGGWIYGDFSSEQCIKSTGVESLA